MCSELDSITTIPAVGSTYEVGLETILVVEAIQKWNIFQNQNHRERDDNADIYGEFGCSDSSKVFPEGINKGNTLCSETRDTFTKQNIRSEEGHHIYISEAELHMHKPQNQVWAKSEVFFQSFVMDRIYVDDGCGGEVEIEVIPTHMVKARSKFHLQASKTEQPRVRVHGNNGQQLHPRPEVSESTKLKLNSGCVSSHSMDESVVELHHGRETERNSVGETSQTTSAFVNSSDRCEAATSVDFVNNVRSSMKETQSKFVNTNLGVTKTVSHLEDEAG